MNRAERRATEARDKMQHNADRVRRLAEEAQSSREMVDQLRALLFAAVRVEGRLLIRAEHMAALGPNDRVDFVRRENGDVVLEYRAGAT